MDDTHTAMEAPSRKVELDHDLSGQQAIQRIGLSSLDLLRYYERLAEDRQPDGVHQMRVSIRRLRAALASYSESYPADQYKWIQRELRWMADVLGAARDLDVFEHSLLDKAEEHDSFKDTAPMVRAPIQEAREKAYDNVASAIRSPRYDALKEGLACWCEASFDTKGELHQPLSETMSNTLGRRYRAAMHRFGDYDSKSEKKRHRLRIAIKKLRYTSEIFGSIYNPAAVEEFTDRLKRLQDDLGDENDVRTARTLFEQIAGNCSSEVTHAGKAILDWHEKRVAGHEDNTRRHLKRFAATPLFWEMEGRWGWKTDTAAK